MKFLKRLSAVAVSVVMMFGITSVNVSAASITQDGLEVSLTTDKETYSKAEKITVTLSMKNTNKSDVTDIAMAIIIPDGYEVADKTQNNKQLDKLASNETTELKVVYATKSSGEVSQDSQISQESQKSEVSTVSQSSETISTGDTTAQLAIIVPIVACSLVLVIFGIRKKKIKDFLSIAVSISVIGSIISYLPFNANAVKENSKTISISQATKVDKKDFTIKANVTYSYVKEEVSQVSEASEMSEISEISASEVEEYYKENAEIIGVVDVSPEETLSEAEVTKLLNEKGFTDYPIIYNYSLSGDFNNDQEGDPSSEVKHPMYGTYYISKNNEIWYVTVVGKEIYANPLSFNIQTERKVPTMLSTSNTIISYDDEKDRLYTVIPKESAMIVVKVDDINSDVLDNLTVEEVNKL